MNGQILPIGSVVKLQEDSNIRFMIVGYFPQSELGERRDYSAIRYPMGVYDNRMYFFFNSEDIKETLHKGYVDEEFNNMCKIIETTPELSNKEDT